MNELITLVKVMSRLTLTIAPTIFLLLCVTPESRPQSAGIRDAIVDLQSKQSRITELEWQLTNLNIRRAYEKNDDYSATSITFDNRRQRFVTSFYVPPNSPVLGSTAKFQIEIFQAEINGLRLELIRMLGLPDSFADKIGMYIEADFVTLESPGFVVIGRYRDAKIQLVHEPMKSSR